MAYLKIEIDGNPNFGGYLSIDREASIQIKDGEIYELDEGQHLFEIHTTTDAQRKMANFQSRLQSSSGMLNALTDMQVDKGTGDNWHFQVMVGHGQLVVLSILSKGNQIISAPMYNVVDLEDDKLEELEEHFEKIHAEKRRIQAELDAERERILNTPRRSKPKIIIGLIMAIYGAILATTFASTELAGTVEAENATGMIASAIIAVAGIVLLVLGLRKKIRK